jgi:hypothetical protein
MRVAAVRLRRLEPLRQQLADAVGQGQQRAQSGVQLEKLLPIHGLPLSSVWGKQARGDLDRASRSENGQEYDLAILPDMPA